MTQRTFAGSPLFKAAWARSKSVTVRQIDYALAKRDLCATNRLALSVGQVNGVLCKGCRDRTRKSNDGNTLPQGSGACKRSRPNAGSGAGNERAGTKTRCASPTPQVAPESACRHGYFHPGTICSSTKSVLVHVAEISGCWWLEVLSYPIIHYKFLVASAQKRA